VKGPTYRSEEEEGSGASFESHVIWGEWPAAARMLEAGDLVAFTPEQLKDGVPVLLAEYLPTHLRLDSCGDGRFWMVRLEQPDQRRMPGEFPAVAS